MRYIDTLDLQWHIGVPTWEIIDELLEMIDASPSEKEDQGVRGYSYHEGCNVGYDIGYEEGKNAGYKAGYHDAYWEVREDKAGHD